MNTRTPTEVIPGLFLAGARYPCPDLGLDLLVTMCHPEEVWYSPSAKRAIDLPLDDRTVDGATADQIEAVVAEVVDAIRNGDRVMVRCHWGMERSALVVALALCDLFDVGLGPAIAQLRFKRAYAVLPEDSTALAFCREHA
jgi:hypothetical protein